MARLNPARLILIPILIENLYIVTNYAQRPLLGGRCRQVWLYPEENIFPDLMGLGQGKENALGRLPPIQVMKIHWLFGFPATRSASLDPAFKIGSMPK